MLSFNLTIEETNLILESLGSQPYVTVSGLIDKIRAQAVPQLKEAEPHEDHSHEASE